MNFPQPGFLSKHLSHVGQFTTGNSNYGASSSFAGRQRRTVNLTCCCEFPASATSSTHSFRVAVRTFSLIIGSAVVGVLAHASAVWFSTRYVVQQQPDGSRQRAWPAQMDLWPTWVMLGAAVIAILVQIVAFLTLCGGVSSVIRSLP